AMIGSGAAGTFNANGDIISGQAFNMDSMVNAGIGGAGYFQPSAFVGGGGIGNGFVGGLANGGTNAYQNGQTVAPYRALGNGQYGNGYGDAINVLFGGGMYGRNRTRPGNQLAEGQDIRSRSQIPIQVSYNIDFPVPPVDPSAISRKLSNELS